MLIGSERAGMDEITILLKRYQEGDGSARDQLFEEVYQELRKLAAVYMRNERRGHTLQPTELVNEAYQRIARLNRIDWQNRSHFFAVAAIQMKRILIDHAKHHNAQRHGGGKAFVDIDGLQPPGRRTPIEVEELREVLERLERQDPRLAQIVSCRFLSGMTAAETAEALGISEKTVRNEWNFGKAWFLGQLSSPRQRFGKA